MLKVAIYEEECLGGNLKKLISEYALKKDIVFSIDTYSDGELLVSLGIELLQYTVIFLDIKMGGINGIITAKKIRDVSKDVFIVFVTKDYSYVLDGYKVGALRYLLRGESDFSNNLEECINTIIEKQKYSTITKKFNFSEGIKEISLERLLYIESKLHKLEFYVMEENTKVYTMYKTLNTLEEELKENSFVRIHQSYFINLKYIKSIEKYEAILTNGDKLTIPKIRYSYVKNKFIKYQREV